MILMFCCYMRHFFIFDYKQLLINNRLLFKKYRNVKLIIIHLIVDVIFCVGYFLYNLSEQKRSIGMWNWFPKFYCCCNFQTVLILTYSTERTCSNILILIQLKTKWGGDYIILVCLDEFSSCSATTDFTLWLHLEIKFRPGKAGQFSTYHLFRFVCIFFEFFFVSMWVYKIENLLISIGFKFFCLSWLVFSCVYSFS